MRGLLPTRSRWLWRAYRGGRRLGPVAALLAACALAGGCASLADRITEPHDAALLGLDPDMQQLFEQHLGVTRESLITPEGVRIAYRVVPAAERGMQGEFERTESDDSTSVKFGFKWTREDPKPLQTRGTVVFLHGWAMDASSMLPWALALSERGYRGIAVDLRNHGLSAAAPVGFGPREAQDIVALVTELRRRDVIEPPLYLFGVSYGAAAALFAEPALHGRIAGIVAMQPFGNAAAAIKGMVAETLDSNGGGLDAWLTRVLVGWRFDDPGEIARAISEVGAQLGIDLRRIDTGAALAASQTCTLLLHGADDDIIPVAVARRLAEAGPHVEYVEVPGHRHMTLPLRVGWLADPIVDWLQATARAEGCPEFKLPRDPALPDPVGGASAPTRPVRKPATDPSGRGGSPSHETIEPGLRHRRQRAAAAAPPAFGGEDRQRQPDEAEADHAFGAERLAKHQHADQQLQGRGDVLHQANHRKWHAAHGEGEADQRQRGQRAAEHQ